MSRFLSISKTGHRRLLRLRPAWTRHSPNPLRFLAKDGKRLVPPPVSSAETTVVDVQKAAKPEMCWEDKMVFGSGLFGLVCAGSTLLWHLMDGPSPKCKHPIGRACKWFVLGSFWQISVPVTGIWFIFIGDENSRY